MTTGGGHRSTKTTTRYLRESHEKSIRRLQRPARWISTTASLSNPPKSNGPRMAPENDLKMQPKTNGDKHVNPKYTKGRVRDVLNRIKEHNAAVLLQNSVAMDSGH